MGSRNLTWLLMFAQQALLSYVTAGTSKKPTLTFPTEGHDGLKVSWLYRDEYALFTNTGPRPAHWYLPSGHLRTFSPSFIDRILREVPGLPKLHSSD